MQMQGSQGDFGPSDPRLEAILARLKSAADLRAASLPAKPDSRDRERKHQWKDSPQLEISSGSDVHQNQSSKALLEFCKDITPNYAGPAARVEISISLPKYSLRDLDRGIQGQQVASNRQARYIRKMRSFLNPSNRVEISHHTLSEPLDEKNVSVRDLCHLCFRSFCTPFEK